jgi:hypothetical protein
MWNWSDTKRKSVFNGAVAVFYTPLILVFMLAFCGMLALLFLLTGVEAVRLFEHV